MRKCVICLDLSKERTLINPPLGVLEDQLTVIYFLDKFLRYPLREQEEMESLLMSTGNNPSEWVGFCEPCLALVEQGKGLYQQAQKIQMELEELRTAVEKRVVDSFEKDSGVDEDLLVKSLRETIYRKSSRKKDLEGAPDADMLLDRLLNVEVKLEKEDNEANEVFVKSEPISMPSSPKHLESNDYEDNEVDDFAIEPETDVPSKRRTRGRRGVGWKYSEFEVDDKSSDDEDVLSDVPNDPLAIKKKDDDEFIISNDEGSSSESYDDDDDDEDWGTKEKYRNNTITRKWRLLDKKKKSSKRISKNKTPLTYTCPVCFKLFTRGDRLKRHVLVAHEKPSDLSCEVCNRTFLTKESLKVHQLTHTQGEDNNELVNKTQLKKADLSNDLEDEEDQCFKKKGKKDKICPVCSRAFRRHDRLRNHINAQHEKTTVYSCETCGKSFYTPDTLRCHMRNHMSREELLKLEESEKLKWRTCPVCKEVFETSSQKRIHYQKSHLPQKLECEKCGKSFPRDKKTYFAAHMEWHETGVYTGKYKCPFEGCTMTFPSKFTYDNHLAKHTGEKRYLCPHCGKSFAYKSAADKHILVIHSENPPQIACTICGKVFKTKWHLKQHMQSISHGGSGFPKSNRSKQQIKSTATITSYDSNNDSNSRNDS